MYLHTPAVEAGSWWRVDTASGSDTGTTVYAHDGTDAIPNYYVLTGSTVRNTTRDGTAQFWSATQTLYLKELTYQGAPNGTVVTSTGTTPAAPVGGAPVDIATISTAVAALPTTYVKLLVTDATSTTLTGTLAAGHLSPVDCTVGPGTRTLPAASSVAIGTPTVAKKADTTTNTLTVQRAGSDLIFGTGAGSTSKTLTLSGEAVTFVSNGVDRWSVESSDTPSSAIAAGYAPIAAAPVASSATSGTLTAGAEHNLSPTTAAAWTLPTSVSATKLPTTVKNNGTATLTVARGGSDTINGGTTSVSIAAGEWARFTSDGAGAWTQSGTAGESGTYVPRSNLGDRAYLLVGGDHPYQQWGGSGMAKAYADYGLAAYLAVNTDANGLEPGGPDMLTWSQLSGVTQRGHEIIAHGARHVQDWNRINTGIKVLYSGANATSTVQISATQMICTAGGGDSVTVTLAGTTLAQLRTAVQAAGSWTVTLAPELTGLEPAAALLQIAATSVKGATVLFAAGGGITIVHSASTYRQAWVQCASGRLKIYGDGRRLLDTATTGATLASLVTAVNAVSGFTAYLCDNQKAQNSSFESYLSGNELGNSLLTINASAMGYGAYVQAGLPRWYMVDRQLQRCADQAAANGYTLREFASSGGSFVRPLSHGHTQFNTTRGNGLSNLVDLNFGQTLATPVGYSHPFREVSALTSGNFPAGSGRQTALVSALADSPGFVLDALVHKILADGSSSYSFPSTDNSYYDQTETEFIAYLAAIGTQVAAGKIVNVTPGRAREILATAPPPKNLVFNPKFKNSGEALMPYSSSMYYIVPQWRLVTASADYTAASIDADGGLNVTTNSTSVRYPVAQLLYLRPGKTYEVGALFEISNYTSGSGAYLDMAPYRGWQRNDGYSNPLHTSSRFATGISEHVKMQFTVPAPEEFQRARIISSSFGTGIDMSTNKNIKLKFYGKTMDNLDLSAGAASASAVQAAEAAAAINAALLAAVKARTFNGEFLNMARSENNTLIIEVPIRGVDQTFSLSVVAATSTDITATVFGSTDNLALSNPASDQDALLIAMELRPSHQLAAGTTYRVSRPYCAEINVQ